MTEAYLPVSELMAYYGSDGTIAHMPMNLAFLTSFMRKEDVTADKLKTAIETYLHALPGRNTWPNFNLGNHDNKRVATRLGAALVNAMNMIMLLLPGTIITYYGEELGMLDHSELGVEVSADLRESARTPMQWNASMHAGFTTGASSWLPIAPGFAELSVASEEKAPNSHLNIYRALTRLRKEVLHINSIPSHL